MVRPLVKYSWPFHCQTRLINEPHVEGVKQPFPFNGVSTPGLSVCLSVYLGPYNLVFMTI